MGRLTIWMQRYFLVGYIPFFVGTLILPIDYRHVYAVNTLFLMLWVGISLRNHYASWLRHPLLVPTACLAGFSVIHFLGFALVAGQFSWLNVYYTVAYGMLFFLLSPIITVPISRKWLFRGLFGAMVGIGIVGLGTLFLGLTPVANPFELPWTMTVNRSYVSWMFWMAFMTAMIQSRYKLAVFFYVVILFNLARIIIGLSLVFVVVGAIISTTRRIAWTKVALGLVALSIASTILFSPLRLVFLRMVVPNLTTITTIDIYDQQTYKSDRSRLGLNIIGLRVIRDHGIWGTGAGRYWQVARMKVPDAYAYLRKSIATPHNTYTYMWATFGILGLCLYLWIFYRMGQGLKGQPLMQLGGVLLLLYLCISEPFSKPMSYFLIYTWLNSNPLNRHV